MCVDNLNGTIVKKLILQNAGSHSNKETTHYWQKVYQKTTAYM